MGIVKICENVVTGAETTFIEVDTDSIDEYYTVQYGYSGVTFPKGVIGKNAAIEDYISNIKHQLMNISITDDIEP